MRRFLLAVSLLALTSACSLESTGPSLNPSNPETETFSSALNIDLKSPGWVKLSPSGVFYKDLAVGTGTVEAARGRTVEVHYTLWLPNGQRLDNSKDRGETFPVTLGTNSVIAGWEIGIPGMRAGGRRLLVIPSESGYSYLGKGSVPPNTTLVFEVEMVAVR